MSKNFLNSVSLVVLFLISTTSTASAADTASVEKLSQMIEQQQKILEAQSRELEAMRKELKTLHHSQQTSKAEIKEIKTIAKTAPPAAAPQAKYVEEGSFPGSIRIPGTAASLKIGGQVKMDAMYTPNQTPGMSEDTFFTRNIQTNAAVKTGRTRFMARDTRLNFDLRSPTQYGDLKAFVDFDLFGASSSTTPQSHLNGYDLRLRHAYLQIGQVLMGQSWSAFNDPASFAETLDFGQVNGESFIRQPQLRYTSLKHNDFTFVASLENPEGDISDNTAPGVGRRTNADSVPDVIGSISLDKDWGHLQTAALYRRIKIAGDTIAPTFTDTASGYGVNVSGKIKTPFINEGDTFRFQMNYGDGIGRYINDLQNIGTESYDAAVDASNLRIQTLKAFGGYASYQALFNEKWRSNLTGGYVHVKQPEFQPGTALNSTAYVAANLIWSPMPKVDIGFEALWGYRENVNGQSGNANRYITSVKYSF